MEHEVKHSKLREDNIGDFKSRSNEELQKILKEKDLTIQGLKQEVEEFHKLKELIHNKILPKKNSQCRYWRNEEHERFLVALRKYGKRDVKNISNYVGTRSPTQVRTHAQKYFLKLQREANNQKLEKQDDEDYGRYSDDEDYDSGNTYKRKNRVRTRTQTKKITEKKILLDSHDDNKTNFVTDNDDNFGAINNDNKTPTNLNLINSNDSSLSKTNLPHQILSSQVTLYPKNQSLIGNNPLIETSPYLVMHNSAISSSPLPVTLDVVPNNSYYHVPSTAFSYFCPPSCDYFMVDEGRKFLKFLWNLEEEHDINKKIQIIKSHFPYKTNEEIYQLIQMAGKKSVQSTNDTNLSNGAVANKINIFSLTPSDNTLEGIDQKSCTEVNLNDHKIKEEDDPVSSEISLLTHNTPTSAIISDSNSSFPIRTMNSMYTSPQITGSSFVSSSSLTFNTLGMASPLTFPNQNYFFYSFGNRAGNPNEKQQISYRH